MATRKKTTKHRKSNPATPRKAKVSRAKRNPAPGRYLIEALQDLDKYSGKNKMRNHKLRYMYWSGAGWAGKSDNAEQFGSSKFAESEARKLLHKLPDNFIHMRVRKA